MNQVTTVRPLVSRIRVQDIPIGKPGGHGSAFISILASIENNIRAGLAEGECLEITPPGQTRYAHSQLLSKIKKLIRAKQYPVGVFSREKDGKRLLYVVGE